jgi:hypothetical protein
MKKLSQLPPITMNLHKLLSVTISYYLLQFVTARSAFAQDITLGTIEGTGKFQESGTALTQLSPFISTMINVITVVAGLAFLLYFAIGGLKWITSSGEKSKAEEAKTELTQAAIGLIVVAVSYFIAGIVGGVVGIDILNPSALLGL